MPTTAQILELEDVNVNQITLHSEGMFWKAYQRSAFLLLSIKSGLKVKKKFIKAVGRDVVSVGFPKASLEKYFSKEQISSDDRKQQSIQCEPIDQKEYQAWFDSIETTKNKVAEVIQKPKTSGYEVEVLKRVREFRIDSSSPLECMMFIGTIQKQLDGYL